MENRIIRSLTIAKRSTTIRGAAKKEKVGATTIRRMLKRKGVKTFKKVKRFLISKRNGVRRKICCGRFRKKFRKADLKNMVWVDEGHVVVGEHLNIQNERCYGLPGGFKITSGTYMESCSLTLSHKIWINRKIYYTRIWLTPIVQRRHRSF